MSDRRFFKLGDTVKSDAIGSREAFTGTISFVGPSYYYVRDEHGMDWHRNRSELSLVSRAVVGGSGQ